MAFRGEDTRRENVGSGLRMEVRDYSIRPSRTPDISDSHRCTYEGGPALADTLPGSQRFVPFTRFSQGLCAVRSWSNPRYRACGAAKVPT